MKKLLIAILAVIVSASVILSDNAKVSISASWVRPDYKPRKFNKVLVISDLKVITRRNRVEKKISDLLNKNGIDAIAGITIFPPGPAGEKFDKDGFIKKMKEINVDGVILVSLIDVKDDSGEKPMKNRKESVDHYDNLSWSYGDFYGWGPYPGYYGYGPSYSVSYTASRYEISYDPNWTDTSKKALLDLVFYEIGKDLLIWKAQSTVGKVDPSNTDKFIDSLSKTFVDRLFEMKLIEKSK